MARQTPRPVLLCIGFVIAAMAGCAAGDGAPSASAVGSSLATPRPTEVPTSVSSPLGSAMPGEMPIGTSCDVSPCVLSAGTWVLTGNASFILGMKVTVPDGWESLEQDAGEFNLFPLAHPNDHIFMVKDVAAIKTDGTLAIVQDVPRTIDGLTTYWRQDPNLVVGPSTSTTIAGGIAATSYVIKVSPTAKFTDRECPVYPLCADLFTDPKYWGGGAYGIGSPAAVRLYLATISSGDASHVFIIGLEGENDAALARLTTEAAPIIASIQLPASFPIW